MRRLVLAMVTAGVVVVGLASCGSEDDPDPSDGTSTTSSTNTTTTSSSSSATACDVGDCQVCASSGCANDHCTAELSACEDVACFDATTCYNDCGEDLTCIETCRATYPDGAALADALWFCVACDPGPCAVDCADHVWTDCSG